VGRQSVREALRVLELSGLITVKSGTKGGAVIEGTMLTKLSGLFLETVKLNRMSLQDCIEAREAIETSVLSFVFRNAKQEDIQALRANVLQAKKKLLHSNDSAFQEHVDFHRLLAQASRNYALKVIVEVILVVFSDFTSGFRSPSIDEPGQIIDLHEGIVEALASKKEAKALELLKKELSLQESRLKAKTSRPVSTEI